MPKESHLEFKVGIFVLAALVGLVVFIFSVTDSSMLEEGKSLEVVFGFANGLKKSAPVRVAGVDQGIVKDIHLFFDNKDGKTKARVSLWIKKSIQIPIDSEVLINQLGLMGEKYLEIIPGLDTKNFFQEGQVILGEDPIAQELLSRQVWKTAEDAQKVIAGIGKIIQDEQNQSSLKETLQHLSSLSGSLSDIAGDIKIGNGTIGRLLYDDQLYDDLQGFTADIKENPWKLLYRPKKKSRK